jgi:hypothetical protein
VAICHNPAISVWYAVIGAMSTGIAQTSSMKSSAAWRRYVP